MPVPMRAALLALALPLAACTQTDAVCAVPSVAASPAAPPGRLGPARTAPAADLPVGRWVAVDVVGDAEASRDLARGTLEKVLVVNPGGHVILRGVDRARSADPVSFTGTLVGRIVRFAELPGAATLVREGTRLVLTDPSGRRTRFVRDAE